MEMVLEEIYKQAIKYVSGLTSKDALGSEMMNEVKYNRSKYEEAILLVHVNPGIQCSNLSLLLGYDFTSGERMDIITGFFLRDILNDPKKAKSGHEILSGRQLTRRRNKESFSLVDGLDYGRPH